MVKKGLRTKAALGLYLSFAPLGYVNALGSDGKRIIVPDPVLGTVITNLFTWFASGECSLKGLAKKAYEDGFRFRKSRNKIPVTALHKILRKRSEFDYGRTRYRGVHEPLVTEAAWGAKRSWTDGMRKSIVR